MDKEEKSKILVVDDEPGMREFLEIMLSKEGYDVSTASNGEQAINRMNESEYDLAVVDIQMPGKNGIEVLKSVKDKGSDTIVIMITAFASHETAIDAMKLGAYDYITKPFKIDEIKLVISKALERKNLVTENTRLKKELENKFGFGNLIGESASMHNVFSLIQKISELNVNVLITGESGTGKELVARAIHYSGNRHEGPFVPVNCGAIPENLIESELFGYKKGAFTGADYNKKGLFIEANEGTIFLDEIGDLPQHLQVKLLRILEDKSVRPLGSTESVKINVRVVSATNKELEREIAEGRFREDLYYRLNVIKVTLPPLRERKEDIPALTLHFVNKYAKDMDKDITGISSEAIDLLEKYNFPGNVRELENIIARSVALETNDTIRKETLPKLNFEDSGIEFTGGVGNSDGLDDVMDDVERKMIENAMKKTEGNKTEAARLLGITLRSLRYRLSKLGFHDGD